MRGVARVEKWMKKERVGLGWEGKGQSAQSVTIKGASAWQLT